MLRFNLEKIIKARGINSTTAFLKECGFAGNARTNIKFGKATIMDMGKLEVMCRKLNCTPNEIIEWVPAAADNDLPAEHALRGLVHRNDAEEIMQMVHNMSYDKIVEVAGMMREMNRKQ